MIKIDDIEQLLKLAEKNHRDLRITMKTDGENEIELTIPSRYTSNSLSEPAERKEHDTL